MTVYHRYVIADGRSASLDELILCLKSCDLSYDIEGEVILWNGNLCGILIDVSRKGNPIFDSDIDLLLRRTATDSADDKVRRVLSSSTCMVTMQETRDFDSRAADAIWDWLRINRKGLLAYEGRGIRIDI
jgi:hypothetical protein